MKKKLLKLGLVLLAVIAVAGCATFDGQMEMEGVPPAVTWISPMNQDGIKDYLDVQISFPAYENLVVREYNIIITDQMENIIFSYGEKAKKKGKSNLTIPNSFKWEGVDQNGAFVSDGEYAYHIDIAYGKTETYSSPIFKVIVDNTAPNLEVSAAFPLFSPDGDGNLDTVKIFQRFSSVEQEWYGSIVDSNAKEIKKYQWVRLARDFIWDGKDAAGQTVSDGEYSYVVSSTDKAGNKSEFNLKGITVNTTKVPVSISSSLDSFSPNGDGKKDVIVLSPETSNKTDITSWIISIHDRNGNSIRSYTGNESLPATINFDGRDNEGTLLSDGFYKGHIVINYKNGSQPENVSQLFEIDNTPPLVNLSADYLLFSPEGDGKLDTITINQSTSIETLWSGAILDSNGKVVKNLSWKDRAVQFTWDGLDSTGKKVPDGTYSYRIESNDKADNQIVKELKGIRIDTRNPTVSITNLNTGSSPDGDGINDIISFKLSTDVPEEISKWEIKIIDKKGTLIKTFASSVNNTDLPSQIDWNGLDERGLVMENEYSAQMNVEYLKGNSVSSKTKTPFIVDITGPQIKVSVSPNPFSPDQDGVDDILSIKSTAKDVSGIDSWTMKIIDPTGNLFRTFSGTGELKNVINWNGMSEKNELVQSASDYTIRYTVKDKVGNISTVDTTTSVDILVIKDGENYKIIISSIYFVPNKADFMSLDEAKITKNLATLDRLAEILKKYSQYRIILEGHAARVYWDNPVKLQTEQVEVLLPLSTERAEVIKEALVARGISAERLSTIGYGGNRPVVPHSDLENRWKNRRVEFILIKK